MREHAAELSAPTGIVLAGGLSSRLGQDKARLVLGRDGEGADLLSRTAALLERVCGRVMIIGRESSLHAWRLDDRAGQGPAGGIATALRVTGCACLVLSCDLPFMEAPVLEHLLRARALRPPEALVTAYRGREGTRLEPLAAVYEPGALSFFERALAAGERKTRLAVPAVFWHCLDYGPEAERFFFNINVPADLEKARHMLNMGGKGPEAPCRSPEGRALWRGLGRSPQRSS